MKSWNATELKGNEPQVKTGRALSDTLGTDPTRVILISTFLYDLKNISYLSRSYIYFLCETFINISIFLFRNFYAPLQEKNEIFPPTYISHEIQRRLWNKVIQALCALLYSTNSSILRIYKFANTAVAKKLDKVVGNYIMCLEKVISILRLNINYKFFYNYYTFQNCILNKSGQTFKDLPFKI